MIMPKVCLARQRGVILIEGPNIYNLSGWRRGGGEEREKNSSYLKFYKHTFYPIQILRIIAVKTQH